MKWQKTMKYMTVILAALFILLAPFAIGCEKQEKENRISIVCTVFSGYDWTRNIITGVQDRFELNYLFSNGTDSHSYQPTVSDIISISECDILITSGGESERWVFSELEKYENSNVRVISMLDIIGELALEEYEGIQHNEEDHHAHGEDTEQEIEKEYDEHIWLSIKNAKVICREIEKVLSDIDCNNSDLYKRNCDEYCEKFGEIYDKYAESIQNSDINTLIFADRFPFAYLMNDLGISYHAAFSGCSAESEASVSTIVKLIELAEECKTENICVIETSDQKLAATVASGAGDISIIVLDSIQAVSSDKISNGYSYCGAMEENLRLVKKALSIEKAG